MRKRTDIVGIVAKIGFGEHFWNLEDGTFLPILRYCKFRVASCTSLLLT